MKQTDRVPHMARGAAESAGVPAERAGAPAESAGVPAQSAGTTKTSYPLMKYLSLLLAVTLLFSGVTFARYLSNDRIDSSVGIAAFDATYSIDRVNSTTFGNQSYWIDVGGSQVAQGSGTAITVGITLKNNGDTSVQPTLHLEGPKEYWDHIALQLTMADENFATRDVLTPQLVIGSIFGKNGKIQTGTDDQTGTNDYDDYGSLGGDATLDVDSVTDVDKTTTTTTATWGENVMTITEKTEEITYSVGFVRESGDTLLPPIYVDCRKTTDIYSIDLELPALEVAAAQKNTDGSRTAAEQKVVVWLTWTTALANTSVSADRAFWGFEGATSTGESNLTGNMQDDKQFSFNNQYVEGSTLQTGDEITVLGYHFDQSGVPVVGENGETTTVRVKKTFASKDGTTGDTTEGKTEYFHVASINNEDGPYVHPFKKVEGADYIECAKGVCVKLSDVAPTPNFTTVTLVSMADPNNVGQYIKENYAPIQQRAFGVSFRATFVQWSEVPAI